MKKGSISALLPLLIFLISYVGLSIVAGDMYGVSVIIPFSIAAISALVINRKRSFNEKLETFCKGAGESNVILMIIIFILAGAFVQVAKDMGAVESTVNLGISILPKNLLIAGLFVIACFIAISVGTSVGTIVALVPIAVGIADKTGVGVALSTAAVVSGAMFGDNLSIISDTTIAATRTQGCEMRDKFKTNFKIVMPAAILTIIILIMMTKNAGMVEIDTLEYSFIKIVPYLAVIIAALCGLNVMIILTAGIVIAGIIGLASGSFNIVGLCTSIASGAMGMSELIIISLMIAGTIAIIKENGGIDFILNIGLKKFKNKRDAELGIAALVSFVDICTANNTIAIVSTGPIAKDISDEFELEPKRVAGILDMFSCVFQGIIPHGAQLISAAGIALVSPFEIMKFLFYPYLMGICALISIFYYNRKRAAR